MLTTQGVYQVEYRAGSPAEHFQTRTLSPETAATILGAWTTSDDGWRNAFTWTNIGAMFESPSDEPVGVESVDVDALVAASTVRGTLRDGREVRSIRVDPAQAVPTWRALRAAHDRTGLWPFLADPPAGNPRPEVWAHLLEDVLTDGRPPTDPDALFAALLTKTIGPDDGDIDDEDREDLREALRCERLVLPPRPASRAPWSRLTRQIGLCPAGPGGWEIPESIKWEGALNYSISGSEHSAVLKSWHQRYGAVIMALTFDTIELSVANPPTDPDEVASVALEQVAYCPDTVFQGVGSVTALAEQQVYSDTWSFWWD